VPALTAMLLTALACGSAEHPAGDAHAGPRPQPLARVEAVLRGQRDKLMERYRGAVGVGIGSIDPSRPRPPTDPAYLIVVYLRDRETMPEGRVDLRGVPIRFVVTGEFRAQ